MGGIGQKMKNPMHEAREALKQHPRCGAHARTTGYPCENPAMNNGRCRMHGGKATGRPIINGIYTKEKKQKYAEAKELVKALRECFL